MTTQPAKPNIDDKCMVCGVSRVDHGDKNHVFSVDGNLIKLEPRPEPKQKPPRTIDEAEQDKVTQELAKSMEINAVLRLTEVLIEKGILDSKDTMFIFSGYKAE